MSSYQATRLSNNLHNRTRALMQNLRTKTNHRNTWVAFCRKYMKHIMYTRTVKTFDVPSTTYHHGASHGQAVRPSIEWRSFASWQKLAGSTFSSLQLTGYCKYPNVMDPIPEQCSETIPPTIRTIDETLIRPSFSACTYMSSTFSKAQQHSDGDRKCLGTYLDSRETCYRGGPNKIR